MTAPSKRRDREPVLELRRDWRGRLRRLRLRPVPRGRGLPLWVRFGLWAPKLEWTLTLIACACALAGGVLLAMVLAPSGAR